MNDDDNKPTLAEEMTRRLRNNRIIAIISVIGTIVIAVAAFTEAVDKLARLLGLRKEPINGGPTQVTFTVTPRGAEVILAIKQVSTEAGSIQTWKRLDSDTQRGFYQMQLAELSKKLTDSHVAPDGVKFMFGIGRDEPHRGWISVFVREGDDKPFVYSVKEEKNNGQEGAVEAEIVRKLKDGPVLPIGWTYKSESFIYATAELKQSSR